MCGERVDKYKFMCNFSIKNTPGRHPKEVHVFSGDGFFDQAMVHDLGFQNARYLKDWFHLFFTGITDMFGQYGAELLEDELKRARNLEYFNQAQMNATTKLLQISPRNMLLEKKLEEFVNANHEYSHFQIDTMKDSQGLHGFSISEQNHASILCNLNDGHTKNNTYCEEPMTLFKDLMERKRLHGIQMNKMLADADNCFMA